MMEVDANFLQSRKNRLVTPLGALDEAARALGLKKARKAAAGFCSGFAAEREAPTRVLASLFAL
jgi:hypothetical protein